MSAKRESDPFAPLRRRVAKKLTGFTTDFPSELESWAMSSHKPERGAFPVPELVLFTLRDLMGWRWHGHGEKVRWTVYGSIDDEPIGFELRKFGFTILRSGGSKVPESRIVGQLQRAIKEVEAALGPFAQAQVEQGEVLMVNRFGEFSARYQFFRDRADKAYAKAQKPLPEKKARGKTKLKGVLGGFVRYMNRSAALNRKGFFFSTAMVDAYFSALEHRLVLLRAFTGTPLEPGELLRILGSKWDDKLKAVVAVSGDRDAERLLATMRRIKERIRNPFAHGGVENDGGSLFFHLPQIGAIPANFTRFGDSVRFSVLPIEADDHAECCAAFDQLDALLSTGTLHGAHRLLDGGIDPSFDPETLKDYADALAGGDEAVEAFIEYWSHAWERHANMDY